MYLDLFAFLLRRFKTVSVVHYFHFKAIRKGQLVTFYEKSFDKRLYQEIMMICHFRLQQCEEDKATKDSQIRSLKQELASQEELVSKLTREKKVNNTIHCHTWHFLSPISF